MTGLARFAALVAYVPVIGWLYVFFFERQNPLAMYHLRQSVGLVLFLIGSLAGWGIVAWLLAWLPYMGAVGMALFTLVIAAYLFGVVIAVFGMIHALAGQMTPLPAIGHWAERLPILR